MDEFEQTCKDQGLTLFMLPPKHSQLNGAIERAQGSWRYEFYACHDRALRYSTRLKAKPVALRMLAHEGKPHDYVRIHVQPASPACGLAMDIDWPAMQKIATASVLAAPLPEGRRDNWWRAA